MKVQFLLFPLGGEEPDQSLEFDVPGVPQPGDCVMISRPDQSGSSEYIVRRTLWDLESPDAEHAHRAGDAAIGTANTISVECEFHVGQYSSEEHKGVLADAAV